MQKILFGFLMVGLAFIALQVETAEAQISIDHPCYDIDPSNGGRDGHACWPKGGHISEQEAKSTSRNAELEYELSAARDALAIAMGEIRSLKKRMSDSTPTRHSKKLQGNSHEGDAAAVEAHTKGEILGIVLCNMLHHMNNKSRSGRTPGGIGGRPLPNMYAQLMQRTCSINGVPHVPRHPQYGRACDHPLKTLRPAECKEYYKSPEQPELFRWIQDYYG